MQSSSFLQPVGGEAGPAVASLWTLGSTRRALESLIAAVALAVSMPLMFVIALAVQLSSGEPILFRQRRTGRNGMEFTLFKFRSMKVKSNDAGPWITVRGDRRITSVGSFLRRYKLDQLPQLWNVLRGDMSIVGPGPKLAHHEGLFISAGPGITGAATLAFRNEEALLAPNSPVVYHCASPNLAPAASTPGADVHTTALQSGTYAAIVQVSQGPKSGQSTTCTTEFELQDAGARS